MKILFALTYYRPHISGLTVYVQRLAEALAARGHQVTVLTSHCEKDLPYEEELNGVRIVRVPVLLRISKGVIMPTFPWLAIDLMRKHDVVSVQLPQFEASLLAFIGRFIVRRPVILTYHCDLQLPAGLFNRFVDQVVFVSNFVAGLLADKIVAYTRDYAEHSRFLSKFLQKIHVVYPPVPDRVPQPAKVQQLKRELGLDDRRVVGMATRFAAEKGVEYLLNAIPRVMEAVPNLQVLYAGQYEDVLGEEKYFSRLKPIVDALGDRWKFLGVLPPAEMANYFALLDCLVVPSVNSTESFGLVQVEAMLCGTPVVASNLPGVREPVRVTGMGEIAPVADAEGLAEAIIRVLKNYAAYVRDHDDISAIFELRRTVESYEALFATEIERVQSPAPSGYRPKAGEAHELD